jgi:hypothetical protein
MIRTTVGEFRSFLADDYGREDDGWFEEICFFLDGDDEPLEDDDCIFCDTLDTSLSPATSLRFQGGVLVFPIDRHKESLSVEALFKKWRKLQTTAVLAIEIDKDRVEEIKTAVKALGGRVLR